MRKIRLVYLVSTLGRTGPTRQLYNLIKYLDCKRFQADVVTLSPNPSNNLEQEFISLGIPVHSLGLSRFTGVIFGKTRLRATLDKIQPDILHSQGLRADWNSSKYTGIAHKVATQRNNPIKDYPPIMGSLMGKIATQLHYYALGHLIVVACSKSISEVGMTHGISARVIHNGVDLESIKLPLSEKQKQAKRCSLGLPADGRLFVYAGPLITRKNPELLIKAFQENEHQRDSLIILGDGPLLSRCRLLTTNSTNIFLPGLVNCVFDYLSVADLFISASRAEGMPNAVLEALGSGIAVLLSDIKPHREILALSPKAGWLFEKDNPNSLIEMIGKIRVGPEAQRGARELSENFFCARNMAKAYQELYLELLNRNGMQD